MKITHHTVYIVWISLKTLRSNVLATLLTTVAFFACFLMIELLIDERDSNGFISRIVVTKCVALANMYNFTDSTLITVGYRLCFLALPRLYFVLDLCTWYYCLIACNHIPLCPHSNQHTVTGLACKFFFATCRLAIAIAPRV